MKLSDYLAAERGRQGKLATALGISSASITQWVSGERPVPADRCPSIERFTNREVLCEDLRPDVDWAYLRTSPVEQAAA